jgi:hypothetical protein
MILEYQYQNIVAGVVLLMQKNQILIFLWHVVAIDLQINGYSNRNLLAIPVGIQQKLNVDAIVQKVMHIFLFDIPNSIK